MFLTFVSMYWCNTAITGEGPTDSTDPVLVPYKQGSYHYQCNWKEEESFGFVYNYCDMTKTCILQLGIMADSLLLFMCVSINTICCFIRE
jgi:hypothetical protein